MKFYRIIVILLVVAFAFGLAAQNVSADILNTGASGLEPFEKSDESSTPGLTDFARSVKNNLPDQVAGVFVEGVLAFPVVQQPSSDPGYVSDLPDTVTQFGMATQYNTIGLLAHDYLAGSNFPELQPGTEITLVFGDGTLKNYQVYEVQEYQALSPADPYSNFVSLSNQRKFSADQLFYHTYGLKNDILVLQTCISKPSAPSWGRIFVMARPIELSQPTNFLYTIPFLNLVLPAKIAY